MKKIILGVAIVTTVLSTSCSLAGWAADTAPSSLAGDKNLPAVPASGEKAGPSTSNYDTPESPLSPPRAKAGVIGIQDIPDFAQAETSKIDATYRLKPATTAGPKEIETLAPHTVIDIHDDIQSALDKLPANGILEIKGQGVLASDTLRIPEGVTINISENVSLVLGDLTAGDLPAGVGSSITSASTAAITESGTIPVTVDSLKTDIHQLQINLKAATTLEERKAIQTSIKKDQKMIQELRKKNLKAIHKIILEAVHTKSKKK